MFAVYDFNSAREEFELLGAWTKREEAEAFLADSKPNSDGFRPTISEMSWKSIIDQEVSARLGQLAEVLKPFITAVPVVTGFGFGPTLLVPRDEQSVPAAGA